CGASWVAASDPVSAMGNSFAASMRGRLAYPRWGAALKRTIGQRRKKRLAAAGGFGAGFTLCRPGTGKARLDRAPGCQRRLAAADIDRERQRAAAHGVERRDAALTFGERRAALRQFVREVGLPAVLDDGDAGRAVGKALRDRGG